MSGRTPGRFMPSRAGIVNLYEYADQVFDFADGRLLLRGHNTSGKTKALELLLPFCLDGDITPRKLDPFAKSAKDMKWNLVGCIDDKQRIGYSWVEFTRLDEDGENRYLAAGVGMKATRDRDDVTRWYFLLADRRIGHDFNLRIGDLPMTRQELKDRLGPGDRIVGTPGEYRRALNDELYRFPSMQQYETMVSLLLELRRPHLSKGLDQREVGRLLSASLPEIDHDLMRRLGEGLEQLEAMQAALASLQQVREQLHRFNRNYYGAYARAILGERGNRLRAANTAFDSCSREMRQRQAALDELRSKIERTSEALAAAKESVDRAEGELRALHASEQWRSVAEVEQMGRVAVKAREAADLALDRLTELSSRLVACEADLIAAGAAADEAESELVEALRGQRALAEKIGIVGRHDLLAAAFTDSEQAPATAGELMRAEASRRSEAIAEQNGFVVSMRRAESRLEEARRVRGRAELHLREAAERRFAREAEAEREVEQAVELIERWWAGLKELHLTPDGLGQLTEAAHSAGPEGAGDARRVLGRAAASARHEVGDERSRLRHERNRLADERRGIEARIEKLRADCDEPPPVPHTRTAERAGRPGAPFWQLVDFAERLAPATRAGLEGALQGAGLLDAWVFPDGRLLGSDESDVLLRPVEGTGGAGDAVTRGETLRGALVSTPGADVTRTVLDTILDSIALADDPQDSGTPCAVAGDGRFRLGPACGRYAKPSAGLIGAAARAARRAELIQGLTHNLHALRERDDDLAAAVKTLDERMARLEAEVEAFPTLEPIRDARQALSLAAAREGEVRHELRQAQDEAEAAAESAHEARGTAEAHAARHGLPADAGIEALAALAAASNRYEAAVPHTVFLARSLRTGAVQRDCAKERLAAEKQQLAGAEVGAGHRDAEARRLEAEHAERERALGSTGAQIREAVVRAEAALDQSRRERERLLLVDKNFAADRGDAVARLDAAKNSLAAVEEERAGIAGAVKNMVASGIAAVALEDDLPRDADEPHAWTLTRTIEFARSHSFDVRSSVTSLANKVQKACGELDRTLAQRADMSVDTELDSDNVLHVRVRRGTTLMGVLELAEHIQRDVDARHAALTEEQRRVFSEALVEEIGEHLRQRIAHVRRLTAEMNATLASCSTGSGKTVQLDWQPVDDGRGDTAHVARLLRRSMATLGESERAPLIEFLRDRIREAREALHLRTGPDAGPAAHLREAFDYRGWFEFALYQVQDGQRVKLTARRHALGSGGEQAVLIHLPLFAAAASLYSSSGGAMAPRLVMLDEALSGIDDQTREKVMHALVRLDLDFVMTSHELWGAYVTVPALSIYQLHRDNAEFGVAAEPFLWDGAVLRELEQGALL